MVEITESKLDELVENAEKMLRYGGKVMSCLDSLQEDGGRMGERSPMGDYRDWGRESDVRGRYGRGSGRDEDGRYGERYGGGYHGGGRW